MKHLRKNRKFGRETKQRKELLRDLMRALVAHSKITTTQAKAKGLKVHIEKLVTKAKAKNIANIRALTSQLGAEYAKKLTGELADKFANRRGGYTRIINLPRRKSDGAKMSIIEFVE